MNSQFSLNTLLFYVINMSSIITLSILSGMLSDVKQGTKLNLVYRPEVRGFLYCVIVVFIGVNVFAFFICNDLNEYALSRILTPYGYRTKLRVLAVLVLILLAVFLAFNLYLFIPNIEIVKEEGASYVLATSLVELLGFCNLLMMNILHPDLLGLRFGEEMEKHRELVRRRDRDTT